ncbi:MAG: hypothetical protein HUU56_06615, partial [Bdellovibrionaceae bacterium]|nr:hypothetical protein [Pseudobdellovibrionaceae bacterium]
MRLLSYISALICLTFVVNANEVVTSCQWFSSDITRQACFKATNADVVNNCKWFNSDETRQACFKATNADVV